MFPWFDSIGNAKLLETPATETLRSVRADLVVIVGEGFLDDWIDLNRQDHQTLLRGKYVYHIGEAPKDIEALIASGIKGYLGFNRFVFLTPQDKTKPPQPVEAPFRELAVTPIKSFMKGQTPSEAFSAVGDYLVRETSDQPQYVRTALISDYKSLLMRGLPDWRIRPNPEISIVTTDIKDLIKQRVEIFGFTPVFLDWLREDPKRISQMTAEKFEDLIQDRLEAMKLNVIKIGNTNTRDGGIDLIAYSESAPAPFFIAVQIKHRKTDRPIGPAVVREFRGSIEHKPLDIGLIVTNTNFSPDAQWVAKNRGKIIRLRGFESLRNWLNSEFHDDVVRDELPDTLELAPGLIVRLPKILRS